MPAVVLAHKIFSPNDTINILNGVNKISTCPILFVNFNAALNPRYWNVIVHADHRIESKYTFGREFETDISQHLMKDEPYQMIPFADYFRSWVDDTDYLVIMLELSLELK